LKDGKSTLGEQETTGAWHPLDMVTREILTEWFEDINMQLFTLGLGISYRAQSERSTWRILLTRLYIYST